MGLDCEVEVEALVEEEEEGKEFLEVEGVVLV